MGKKCQGKKSRRLDVVKKVILQRLSGCHDHACARSVTDKKVSEARDIIKTKPFNAKPYDKKCVHLCLRLLAVLFFTTPVSMRFVINTRIYNLQYTTRCTMFLGFCQTSNDS